MQELMEMNRGNAQGRLEALKRLYGVEVLILDDMGAEKASEYVGATLSDIIDARYREQLTTIITSNLSLYELKRKYNAADPFGRQGTRITDRLREMCKVIKLDGASRRQNNEGV